MNMQRHALAALLAFTAPCVIAAEQSFDGLAEAQLDVHDAARSWTDRGLGKLRGGNDGDDTDAGATLRVALDYRAQFAETLGAQIVFDGYAGEDSSAGITEGWLAWTPVPRSAWQHRVRAGGFIPPFSLEHTATGWTSPYMPTASMLNSWIGEELHVSGVEYTLRRLGAVSGSPHTVTLRAGAFRGNDTAGTVLSWRGWTTNDRVTRRGDLLPLPRRAAFATDGTYPGTHDSDPFVDLDDRTGYYLAAEWRYSDVVKFLGARYDNRADPLAFADGQAGWRTAFNLLGAHYKPSGDSDVLFQYATGNTFVGRHGSQYSADNDFMAWFLLGRQTFSKHQLSVRVEGFEVTDEDVNRLDDNREQGNAFAVAWQYALTDTLLLGSEFLEVQSERPERARIGLPADITERQLRVMLRATF